MKRAAVLIGVDRTGDLPALRDAAVGANRMAAWARDQQMDSVRLITDEGGRSVHIAQIKSAIRELVEVGLDQLVIYFAGHGVNRNYGEYWLLTDAPDDTQEAVNVQGSALLAARCGVAHVVLISDACRTAADGIRAGHVTGSEIFPNTSCGGLEQPVDLFFACLLGRPAYEILDADRTTREYAAVYTSALLDGVQGRRPELMDWMNDKTLGYVRPRRLKTYLHDEVTRRISATRLKTTIIQVPDAHIVSDDHAWIARHATERPEAPPAAGSMLADETSVSLANELFRRALISDPRWLDRTLHNKRDTTVLGMLDLTQAAARTALPFTPSVHKVECGFQIRGGAFAMAECLAAQTEIVTPELVRVRGLERPGASVLLELDTGNGLALPAIRGFLAELTIENGELVDVAYVPSDEAPTFRGDPVARRRLRAVASTSTRRGTFRLERADAQAFTRALERSETVDPSLAVYVAYAYQGTLRGDLIGGLHTRLRADLGASLYDVALLAGASDTDTLGFAPMLARGWPLLAALRVRLPASLRRLELTLVPSVWTLHDPTGVELIRDALRSRAVR